MRWLIFVLALSVAVPAHAADTLDVGKWVDRARVKLVVVEFYATWCKPCMAAIPRWKKLHDKYRSRGLRLIVVNTRDPEAGCRALPWNPDKSLCDYDGETDQRFGVAGKLPSAFLWSWQGELLVKRGHVEDVEKAVKAYFKSEPRVLVEATAGKKPDRTLQTLVEGELSRSGKLTVVASAADRKRLRRLRKATHGVARRDDQKCELGQEISPSSVLVARRYKAGRAGERLSLSLQSLETGCMTQSATVKWVKRDPAGSVSEGVSALLETLRRPTQMPTGARLAGRPAPAVDQKLGGAPADTWDPGVAAKRHVVKFKSTPAGAVVMVDGALVCNATPCAGEVTGGRHTVELQRKDYQPRRESLQVTAGVAVDWTLTANFAQVTVTSTPSGLPVKVNGEAVGQTPLKSHRLAPGVHELVVGDRCFHATGQRLSFKRGDDKTLTFELKPRPSGIDVSAKDDKGNALVAAVSVDGRRVGKTPGRFKVGVCSESVTVRHKTLGEWTGKLRLREKEVSSLTAVLQSAPVVSAPRTSGGAKWSKIPAGSFTMGSTAGDSDEKPPHTVGITRAFFLQTTEVTQGQWKALMGTSPSGFSSCGSDCPVEKVSWWDAAAYCNALSKRERLPACYTLSGCSGRAGDGSYECSSAVSVGPSCRGYRLPTEAEWEYAARAGTTGARYGDVGDIAWYLKNSGNKTHRVGTKRANKWGLHDMLGNVWEWTSDWHGEYSSSRGVDPEGPSSSDARVSRGGSWYYVGGGVRAAYRYRYGPSDRHDGLGFRPARLAGP